MEILDASRVVLTEGRFVGAGGFVVSQDGREATLAEGVSAAGSISLTWLVEGER
jgi:hypothetical protein